MQNTAKSGEGAALNRVAQAPETPIKISFLLLQCFETQGEGSPDEPYVVFYVADLSAPIFAKGITKCSGVFRDVDDDETHKRRNPLVLWGIDNHAAPIKNPDDVIILVALMENDESTTAAVVNAVEASLSVTLNQYRIDGLSRAQMIQNLIRDMNGAIDLGKASGGINQDERLGTVQEFRLTQDLLREARKGKAAASLHFNADGKYRVQIDLSRG